MKVHLLNEIGLKIMKLKQLVLYILLVSVVALSACTSNSVPESSTPAETAADIEPTDTPEAEVSDDDKADDDGADDDGAGSSLVSPLDANSPLQPPAAAVEPEDAPVIEAEYDGETGAVTGLLRARHNDGDIRPLAAAVIGLGALVPRDDGEGNIGAAYSPSDSPRATIDDNGIFVMSNVEPGEYALILDAVVSQSLMSLPDESGDFFITVKAGEQVDLGIIEYETLPYPGFVN